MEKRREYSEGDSLDENKTAAEYGNTPKRASTDNPGNQSFGKTTGSGYSEAERNVQDGTNSDNGSQFLVDKYNINDQAYSDSSLDDFVKTTSGFRHAEDVNPDTNFNENPGGISNAD